MTGPEEDLESLRRRLYRRGAGEDDAIRYRDEQERAAAGVSTGVAPLRTPSRPRALAPIAIAGGVLCGAVLLGVVLAPGRTASTAARASAPSTAGATDVAGTWSARFRAAGAATPTSVLVDGRPQAAQQVSGTGATAVPLGAEWSADRGGRLLIRLESDAADPIGWSAVRPLFGADGRAVREVVAQAAAAPRDSGAVPTLTPFTGAPPVSVLVRAPAGVRWTITTALVDRTA